MKLLRTVMLVTAGAIALGVMGCDEFERRDSGGGAVYSGQPQRAYVIVREAPPQPYTEYRSSPPSPGYTWIDGYWHWNGQQYVWESGRWAAPPLERAVWIAPRYERAKDGYRYIPGHWSDDRRDDGRRHDEYRGDER